MRTKEWMFVSLIILASFHRSVRLSLLFPLFHERRVYSSPPFDGTNASPRWTVFYVRFCCEGAERTCVYRAQQRYDDDDDIGWMGREGWKTGY